MDNIPVQILSAHAPLLNSLKHIVLNTSWDT